MTLRKTSFLPGGRYLRMGCCRKRKIGFEKKKADAEADHESGDRAEDAVAQLFEVLDQRHARQLLDVVVEAAAVVVAAAQAGEPALVRTQARTERGRSPWARKLRAASNRDRSPVVSNGSDQRVAGRPQDCWRQQSRREASATARDP